VINVPGGDSSPGFKFAKKGNWNEKNRVQGPTGRERGKEDKGIMDYEEFVKPSLCEGFEYARKATIDWYSTDSVWCVCFFPESKCFYVPGYEEGKVAAVQAAKEYVECGRVMGPKGGRERP